MNLQNDISGHVNRTWSGTYTAAYEPDSCCSIGPYLITQHLRQMCPGNMTVVPAPARLHQEERKEEKKEQQKAKKETQQCRDVLVWSSEYFCPIHYGYLPHQLQSMFCEDQELGPAFFAHVSAFYLHLFYSLSHRRPVSLTGDFILKEAATRNCPKVVQILKSLGRFL